MSLLTDPTVQLLAAAILSFITLFAALSAAIVFVVTWEAAQEARLKRKRDRRLARLWTHRADRQWELRYEQNVGKN